MSGRTNDAELSEDIYEHWRVGGKGWDADDVERWMDAAFSLEEELIILRDLEERRRPGADAVNLYLAKDGTYKNAADVAIETIVRGPGNPAAPNQDEMDE